MQKQMSQQIMEKNKFQAANLRLKKQLAKLDQKYKAEKV